MSWMVMSIIWISGHSMKIPSAKSMNAKEGIVPILNVYVRMRFWISVRWRQTTLPHGVTEAELLPRIARCSAATVTVGKAPGEIAAAEGNTMVTCVIKRFPRTSSPKTELT